MGELADKSLEFSSAGGSCFHGRYLLSDAIIYEPGEGQKNEGKGPAMPYCSGAAGTFLRMS
jgi:hypothetical protein